jgi:Rieske Fe-S protein
MAEARACDHSCAIGRREFLSGTAALAALAMLEACGAGTLTGVDAGTLGGGPIVVTLSQYPALANIGTPVRVDGGSGTPVALVRTSSATFTALSMVCTHQGTTVNISGGGFLCPNHGARFASSGQWQGGQPTSSLFSISNTYDATTQKVTINR